MDKKEKKKKAFVVNAGFSKNIKYISKDYGFFALVFEAYLKLGKLFQQKLDSFNDVKQLWIKQNRFLP